MKLIFNWIQHRLRQHRLALIWSCFFAIILSIIIASVIYNAAPRSSSESNQRYRLTNPFGSQPSYGSTYYVSPNGNDKNDGLAEKTAFKSINKAVSYAEAGNTIQLADGLYRQTISSVKSGTPGKPIILRGSQAAVVNGSPDDSRIVEVRHNYITLDGFTIDGASGDARQPEDFQDKLLYVIGNAPRQGVEGLHVTNMLIQNGGGECVRLRYYAANNEIDHSTIRNCGIYDFRFDAGSKNGEGIYIGTAPEQTGDGKNPTSDVDTSHDNHIHNNIIETHGNECVDIKEGSHDNIVEHNTCRYQSDPESGGYDARGSNNTIRYNVSEHNKGAGVRLGGDKKSDGINNKVYGNTLTDNKNGVMKITRLPQSTVCGNKSSANGNGDNTVRNIDVTKKCNNSID